MHNPKNSQPPQTSRGYVLQDFEEFVLEAAPEPDIESAVKMVFYTAYLMCYNRLMTALRASNDSKIAVEVTAAVREELINYLSAESERGTMN